MESSKRFKMFKKGKQWATMAIGTALLSFTTLSVVNQTQANADTTDDSTQTESTVSNNTTSTNSVTLSSSTDTNTTSTTQTSTTSTDNSNTANTTESTTASSSTTTTIHQHLTLAVATSSTFSTSSASVKNGEVTEDDVTYYYVNNEKQSDYFYTDNDGKVYYFGDDGKMYQDQFYSNWGNMYYFGEDGARYTEQFYSNWGNMYYFGEDGVRYTNQFYSNWGNMYYFGEDGVRYTNQFYTNWGNTYYFDEDGVRYTNKLYSNWGNTYYFDSYGALLKNQTVEIDGVTYKADSNGVLTKVNTGKVGISDGAYGVDVSSYQGTNMSGYASNGATFTIVKLTEGTTYVNSKAEAQIDSAQANNQVVLGYHFATFSSNASAAQTEANFAIAEAQALGLPSGSYLALDWETGDGNVVSGSTSANTNAILTFMNAVAAAGYKPLLYSGAYVLRNNVNTSSVISAYPNSLWVASYPTSGAIYSADVAYFPSMDGVAIWQFTDNWKGLGVDGNIAVQDL